MRKITGLKFAGLVLFLATTTSAYSADYGGAALCINANIYKSSTLELGSAAEMRSAVGQQYQHALDVSEQPTVISSTSHLFTWASEAKVSCAKAGGYLSTGEVNEDQIRQCDCYYNRMKSLLH